MTPKEIEEAKAQIDKLTRFDMASLCRFAPAGHPYFDRRLPLAEYFQARFHALGGFSPAISKALSQGKIRRRNGHTTAIVP